MRSTLLAVALLGMIMLVGGCKGQDKAMGLRYVPAKSTANPADAPVYVLLTKEAHGLPSNRNNQRIIGEIVHRNGKKQADILSAFPINEWARNAIAGELRAAGVNASEADAFPAGAPVVESTITRMQSKTDLSFSTAQVTATLGVEFVVTAPGGTKQTFAAQAEGTAKGSQGPLINCRDAYERAMQAVLREAVPKIVRSLR
ncbi:MAG: hypothetical protein SFY69_09945 [Planctomycetota bacterium]|nr:hypothetical protein [Planctomycetota bacterium]